MCAVPRGFVLCKVAYTFEVVCLTDVFTDLESVVVLFCLLKYYGSVGKMAYETVCYVDDCTRGTGIYLCW